MPAPVGYRVAIEVRKVEEKTAGGVYLPDSALKASQQAMDVGTVIGIGPECFKDTQGNPQDPWFAIGDEVYFVKYAGQLIELEDGRRVRIMNDLNIWAKVEPGDVLKGESYVR